MEVVETDGRKLAAKIKEYGWSQMEFAERIGLSQSTISHICTGKRMPSLDVLDRICNALGIPHSDLLDPGELQEADSDGINATLSSDENAMLAKFRTLSPRDKRAVLSLIDSLTYPEKGRSSTLQNGEENTEGKTTA